MNKRERLEVYKKYYKDNQPFDATHVKRIISELEKAWDELDRIKG